MRRVIGVESSPYFFVFEQGDITRYAQAIGDANPHFTDAAAARKIVTVALSRRRRISLLCV